MTIPYWDFMGSTLVTNNYIRLTSDIQSQQGAIWNTVVNTKKILCSFYKKNFLLSSRRYC